MFSSCKQVIDAYALIGDVSGLAEKIQSFFMQEALTESHSALRIIVQEVPFTTYHYSSTYDLFNVVMVLIWNKLFKYKTQERNLSYHHIASGHHRGTPLLA